MKEEEKTSAVLAINNKSYEIPFQGLAKKKNILKKGTDNENEWAWMVVVEEMD